MEVAENLLPYVALKDCQELKVFRFNGAHYIRLNAASAHEMSDVGIGEYMCVCLADHTLLSIPIDTFVTPVNGKLVVG